MELISENRQGFRLILEVPNDIMKPGMSEEEAQQLLEIAYQPTIEKLNIFLTATIGSRDFESIRILEETMGNIAKSKVRDS